MIPKEILNKYSCKRKRDYVTGFAIGFFFLIVILELYLIFWVPIQLQREGVLQKHVAKEHMSKTVDYYRETLKWIKTDTSLQKGEVALAGKMLNMYANYIRVYQDEFSLHEILEVTELLKRYSTQFPYWSKGDFAFKQQTISLKDAMQNIEKKNGL